ncbi:MAG: mevalonate kinase [Bacteroidales bacterium]
MKASEFQSFPAKILLFGEYSIILGGQALTLPLHSFSAQLAFSARPGQETSAAASNKAIKEFLTYLHTCKDEGTLLMEMDLKALEKDLDKGLFLQSDIPSGYGAGSSGALVAAVFEAYSLKKTEKVSIPSSDILDLLRRHLSVMESYFHGNSSGLDPLTCLFGRSLRVDGNKGISAVDQPLFSPDFSKTAFLIDSGRAGTTRPLVEWFRQQLAEDLLDSELMIALNNQTIQTLLTQNFYLFDHFLSQLSMFQLENMRPMVPERIRPLWQEGLENGQWTLKICGSGGGGFVLGFAEDIQSAQKVFNDQGFTTLVPWS